jgi:hypothetical protein
VRLDHLLSKEEEVRVGNCLVMSVHRYWMLKRKKVSGMQVNRRREHRKNV